MHNEFDIAISSPVESEDIDAIVQDLKGSGARVVAESHGSEPQASFFLLAAAFVIMVTRKYFETLGEEAARDQYRVLRRAARRLLKLPDEYDLRVVVSSSSPQKAPKGVTSVASVCFIERPGELVKFAFVGLSEAEREVALNQMFSILEAYCRGDDLPGTAEVRSLIATGRRAWRYVLVFDAAAGNWKIADIAPGPPSGDN